MRETDDRRILGAETILERIAKALPTILVVAAAQRQKAILGIRVEGRGERGEGPNSQALQRAGTVLCFTELGSSHYKRRRGGEKKKRRKKEQRQKKSRCHLTWTIPPVIILLFWADRCAAWSAWRFGGLKQKKKKSDPTRQSKSRDIYCLFSYTTFLPSCSVEAPV